MAYVQSCIPYNCRFSHRVTTFIIIATIILRALPEVLRQVADYRMLAYSVLLIVIMLLNSSPQFAEWKGRWSLKALLSLGKTRKEKTKKEAAKK